MALSRKDAGRPGRSRRLLALALGVVLPLVVLDGLMRWTEVVPLQRNPLSGFHRTDRWLGWLGTPGYRARFRRPEFDVVIHSDADGFRLPAGPQAAEGAPVVAVLGDSFTWGWGVGQGQVFTDHLQALVGPSLAVENYGVNAYGSGQQLLLLERLLAGPEPDPEAVVVMFYANDLKDNRDPKDGERPWFRLAGDDLVRENLPVERGVAGWWREVWRRSPLLSAVRYHVNAALSGDVLAAIERPAPDRAARDRAVPDKEPEPESAPGHAAEHAPGHALGRTPQEELEAWRLQRAILAEMRVLCALQGVDLRVVNIPSRRAVEDPDAAGAQPGRRLAELCGELGIAYLDLAAGLRARVSLPAGGRLYFPDDGHWTPHGHRAAAEILGEAWFAALRRRLGSG